MKLFVYTFLLLLFSVPAMAQQGSPIEVTADNALEWNRAEKTFKASGNAAIIQGESSIKAPTIKAFYDEGDSITIRQVVAEPDALLKQPEETLTAQKVTADFASGVLSTVTATGNVVMKTDKETLYGDMATYDANKRVITVTGHVRIEQGKNLLTGSKAVYDMNTNISTMTAANPGDRVKATFYSGGAQ